MRLEQGMVEEVRALRQSGVPDKFLSDLGLEYRFILSYLIGEIQSREELVDQLGRDGERCYAPQGASGSKAEGHLTEGIEHFEKEHWDVAKKHFTEGAKADPPSAEVHYDVALVLDKMGDHTGATEHFKKGLRARKEQSDIQNSGLLKKHLKM